MRCISYDEAREALRACESGGAEGSIITGTSFCGPLLQLAHEMRLEGMAGAARHALAHVVWVSAVHATERRGDMRHHEHVFPYCERPSPCVRTWWGRRGFACRPYTTLGVHEGSPCLVVWCRMLVWMLV